jgi:hypothetical protein
MKAFDVISRPPRAGDANVTVQIRHLLNLGSLVATRSRSGAPPDHTHERRRDVLVWLPAFVAATVILCGAFAVHWIRVSFAFWLEHTVKMVAFACWGVTALNLLGALWRLAGVRSLHSPATALIPFSPPEFWRRWNRPVGEWLHCHVFQRIHTLCGTSGAILATFAVSGLLHEYFVGMIAGRITGLPMAFFLIQGVAVTATFRLVIKPRWLPVAAVFTFLFMVGTSPLLFSPFNRVMPFYQNPLPSWIDFPFTRFTQPAREGAASGLGHLREAGLMSAHESSQAAAHALPGERP